MHSIYFIAVLFLHISWAERVNSPLTASAAPVLFLKFQDETFNVGQFLMQVLTTTLFFPVTWVPLQRKSIHVKKKSIFYLLATIPKPSLTFLNFLYSWTIFSSST